jgi:hypothetical protein
MSNQAGSERNRAEDGAAGTEQYAESQGEEPVHEESTIAADTYIRWQSGLGTGLCPRYLR